MTAVPLYYEEHGSRDGNCSLLLVAGHGGQLTDWYPGLIEAFVARDFHVVALDNRDAGLSPHFEDSGHPDLQAILNGELQPPYTLDDMADDVTALVDKLELARPIVVAHSLGTMIAQCLAISHPSMLGGMVLIAGTTGDRLVGQPREDIAADLVSGPRQADDPLESAFQSSSRWASWDFGMTEELLRARLRKRLERGVASRGSARQLAAIVAAADRTEALQGLNLPTFVIHGANDPLVTVSGGRALAATIPDAELIILDKLMHDIPPLLWPTLVDVTDRVRSSL